MKRRLLFTCTVLALVLTTFIATPVLAAGFVPFNASGTIAAISPGDVFAAGVSGRYTLKVNDKITPLEMVPTPYGFDLPMLSISGQWNIVGGTPGSGTYEAWLIFVPTPDGHVGYIPFSSFNLTGKWK